MRKYVCASKREGQVTYATKPCGRVGTSPLIPSDYLNPFLQYPASVQTRLPKLFGHVRRCRWGVCMGSPRLGPGHSLLYESVWAPPTRSRECFSLYSWCLGFDVIVMCSDANEFIIGLVIFFTGHAVLRHHRLY